MRVSFNSRCPSAQSLTQEHARWQVVPKGQARVRVQHAVAAFTDVGRELGVIA